MLRFMLCLTVCFCLGLPAFADDPMVETARARALLKMAKCQRDRGGTPAVKVVPTYADGYKSARESGKPLVAFVSTPARDVPGAVVVQAIAVGDVRTPTVIVGSPRTGVSYYLPGSASLTDITATVRRLGCACPNCPLGGACGGECGQCPVPVSRPINEQSYFAVSTPSANC